MNPMKKSGFIAAAIFLMFFVACGGNGNKNNSSSQTYSVSFNSNGGSSITAMQVNRGGSISAPTPEPTRTGFIFNGWYSNSGLTNSVTFPYAVNGNITLYAKWTPIDGSGGNFSGIKTFSGTVTANDGITPIAGATVYIPDSSSTTAAGLSIQAAAGGESCWEPGEAYKAYTCTDAGGQFSLTVTLVSADIVILEIVKNTIHHSFNIIATISPTQTLGILVMEEISGTVIEKASVKYRVSDGAMIFTFDNYGARARTDCVEICKEDEDDYVHAVIIENRITGTNWASVESTPGSWPYGYEIVEGQLWLNVPDWYLPLVSFFTTFTTPVLTEEELAFLEPYKQPNRMEIAGKSCVVYTFTADDGREITVALWNGLRMLMKIDGVDLYLAQAITLDVPESAFTRTLNITWID